MLSLNSPEYGTLSEKPTLSKIPKLSIPEKVNWIIELSRRTAKPYYYLLTGKTLFGNPSDFQKFLRSKYITEPGEIFRHPVRFLQTNGDCDDQTTFFLSNWFAERNFHSSPSSVQIIIVKNKKFLHISQIFNGKIFDFLPYRWPAGSTIIYRKTVN